MAPDATTTPATLTVNAALGIAPTTLTAGVANTLYHQTISVTGGTTPYTTFSVSGFSAGGTGLTSGEITANASAGTIVVDGTPTASGSASFTVNVTDTVGATVNRSYTITVNSANQPPTDISLSIASVAENQPTGTAVGTLCTTDPDSSTFTYSLVTGTGSTDNASFTISGSTLQTAASFNYEAKSSYSVRIRSTDQGGLYTEKVFTINVTNVNEQPTDISLSNASVAENQPVGTTVGTLSTTDPDSGNTFTYSLVTGTGSTDNASFTISGSTLQTAASFNYEAKSSYSVRIRSTDQGGLYTEKAFTINVTNVNEPPTDISSRTPAWRRTSRWGRWWAWCRARTRTPARARR